MSGISRKVNDIARNGSELQKKVHGINKKARGITRNGSELRKKSSDISRKVRDISKKGRELRKLMTISVAKDVIAGEERTTFTKNAETITPVR